MLPGHKKIINMSNITEVDKIGHVVDVEGKKLYFMNPRGNHIQTMLDICVGNAITRDVSVIYVM
jgi:hypothetical protein